MSKSRALIVVTALMALTGCKSWLFDKQPDNMANSTQPIAGALDNVVANVADGNSSANQLCASQPTYDALKKQIFDAAKKRTTSSPAPLNSLQNATVVRMDSPLVVSDDPELRRTSCTGTLNLILPPAAANAFGGVTTLSASLQYAVQPAADASGIVVQQQGADSIIGQLASATDSLNQSKGAGVGSVTSFAGKTYNPSFDCGGKLTNTMRMICQDGDLAKKDRDLDGVYRQLKAATPKPDLPAFIQAQRNFIHQRDACADTDCMSSLYDERQSALGQQVN